MQLVLPIEKKESDSLPKLEPAICREVAQLLRALIGECVAAKKTGEDGE